MIYFKVNVIKSNSCYKARVVDQRKKNQNKT